MEASVSTALGLVLVVFLALYAWRLRDYRADEKAMQRLVSTQPHRPARFDPARLAGLPAAAQRYFRAAIEPGTPLFTVARIEMRGRFGMGSRERPGYMAMSARQVLAAPEGFVWSMSARRGPMIFSGSDSERWTRFWLMGVLPVARLGGDPDHARSAFGRYVAEAVFWTPAALLPGPGVTWEALGQSCARVTVAHGGLSQAVDVEVDSDGRPCEVRFDRWSNANAERRHRLQPFGGRLSAFRSFDGFCLPTHVEAGNHFGTPDYFPFFVVDVTRVDFPEP
ncbi:MAG: hypothetical protein HND55_00485 [Pseudomonadota bacterium]|nr:MAG: hypothetical protein HND55_00485 [Pseudomonadota bacterium]